MSEKPSPESQSDKAGESVESPMRRFEDLARGLLRVRPDQLKDEQARYVQDDNRQRRGKLKGN